MQSIDHLRRQFAGIPHLSFDDETGLVRLNLDNGEFSLKLFLQGAHLAHFQLAGQKPLLFMSESSHYEVETPIRGGIPLVFPWFGARRKGRGGDQHGFARTLAWELTGVQLDPEPMISLQLADSARTRLEWAPAFRARYFIYPGEQLTLSLEVENLDETTLDFEAALHTYFAVSHIQNVEVSGLDGCRYWDQVEGEEKEQAGGIRFAGETDRIYLNVPEELSIRDEGWDRNITINSNGLSAVVWNPWVEKAARMPDFGDEEWPQMVCVESGAVRENEVFLAPGENATLSVTYSQGPGLATPGEEGPA